MSAGSDFVEMQIKRWQKNEIGLSFGAFGAVTISMFAAVIAEIKELRAEIKALRSQRESMK